jgi:hypothetical protein
MPRDMEVALYVEAWDDEREERAATFVDFLKRAAS